MPNPILRISPPSFHFYPVNTEVKDKDTATCTARITITNLASSPIAFKFKTNAPQKCKVTPAHGTLVAKGDTCDIIVRSNGCVVENVDKFLIQFMQVSNEASITWTASSSSSTFIPCFNGKRRSSDPSPEKMKIKVPHIGPVPVRSTFAAKPKSRTRKREILLNHAKVLSRFLLAPRFSKLHLLFVSFACVVLGLFSKDIIPTAFDTAKQLLPISTDPRIATTTVVDPTKWGFASQQKLVETVISLFVGSVGNSLPFNIAIRRSPSAQVVASM